MRYRRESALGPLALFKMLDKATTPRGTREIEACVSDSVVNRNMDVPMSLLERPKARVQAGTYSSASAM